MNVEEKNWILILYDVFGLIRLPMPKNLEEKYEKEIKFLDLNLEPYKIFSGSIFFSILVFSLLILFSYLLRIVSIDLIIIFILLIVVLLYFLLSYTGFYSKYIRAKASSEIMLSIIYMAISMRINQNLEKAVEFAASNLYGPIGKDLKKILFNIRAGKAFSIKEELSKIAGKWKIESQEFSDAINILKESVEASQDELEKNLLEAINIVMIGTKRKMKEYAIKIKTPVAIVNAFGILAPLLMMIFLPVGIILLPEVFKHTTIAIIYTFVLPSVVYMFLLQNFYSRPYSYHQISINFTKKYKERKKILMISIFILLVIFSFLVLNALIRVEDLNLKFFYSMIVTNLLGFGIFSYLYLLYLEFENISEKIFKYEEELPTALYQISIESHVGKPLEKILENMATYSKTLEISAFFREITDKVKVKSTTLKEAIFDEKEGVLLKYPSRMLSSCMKAMIDIAEKGSYYVSETLKSISHYLDSAMEINKFTDETLSEVTSEMKVTSYIFAPLAGGIIVGLMSVLFLAFAKLIPHMEEGFFSIPKEQLSEILEIAGWILNLNKYISLEYFQIVVGIYIIEIVLILSWFLGEITYGENEIRKLKEASRFILIALVIYNFVSISIYGIMYFVIYKTWTS